jgi:hypothetical protein
MHRVRGGCFSRQWVPISGQIKASSHEAIARQSSRNQSRWRRARKLPKQNSQAKSERVRRTRIQAASLLTFAAPFLSFNADRPDHSCHARNLARIAFRVKRPGFGPNAPNEIGRRLGTSECRALSRPLAHSLNVVFGHRGLPHGCGQAALSRKGNRSGCLGQVGPARVISLDRAAEPTTEGACPDRCLRFG